MEKGNQSSHRLGHVFKVGLLLALISLINPAHALTPEAEAHYQSFLDIYRSPNPTSSELQAALQSLEQANTAEQNVYKIVFSLGAINSTLKNWEQAVSWLQAAKQLATTPEQVESIDVELNYCQVQLARREVANWGPDPVKVSFIMKKGTVEMSEDTVSQLPRVLPLVSVQESPEELIQTLRQALDNSQEAIGTKNGFVIVTMEDDFSPEQHYQRGISSFTQYFKQQYFTKAPECWVVVILSARPWHLVNATESLYPTVDLPEYAPFLGYYNPTDNLIMATGGRAGYGTLLHELIHALIIADFPDAPAWLNEGLASLYERTKWKGNKLVTLPNWRMDRMREFNVSSLQQLSDDAEGLGLHSPAIADFRLLFLFLDHKGLMSDFYTRVKTSMPDVSISQILANYDITESDWRQFLQETFASYRAEIARQSGALSHPDEIKYVQQALKATVNPNLVVDGDWGANTDKALTDFQRQQGLEPDGIMGPKTAAKLKAVYERKRVSSLPDS